MSKAKVLTGEATNSSGHDVPWTAQYIIFVANLKWIYKGPLEVRYY